MAETLKQTQNKLQSRIAQLLNQAAKETDLAKKARLKEQAKNLNEQLKESKKSSGLEKNLSVVEKAKKELARLNALDPNTPGVAPLKNIQEEIIADASVKGLPAVKGTSTNVLGTPKKDEKSKPTVKSNVETDTRVDTTALDKAAAAKAAANKIKKPITKPGAVVPKGFDPGSFRMADEASMAKATRT